MVADQDDTADDGAAPAGAASPQAGPGVDKRTLLKRIATASGLPAPQARKLLDAALTEIGAALDSGETLVLSPLGKLRPVRKTEQGGVAVHTLRLRRTPPEASDAPAEGSAEAAAAAQVRSRGKAGGAARTEPGAPES